MCNIQDGVCVSKGKDLFKHDACIDILEKIYKLEVMCATLASLSMFDKYDWKRTNGWEQEKALNFSSLQRGLKFWAI